MEDLISKNNTLHWPFNRVQIRTGFLHSSKKNSIGIYILAKKKKKVLHILSAN